MYVSYDTVDDVVGDKESGFKVVLREPEEPRFEPPPEGEEVLGGPQDEVMNEDDLLAPLATSETPEAEEKEEVVFVIDQEEFEKEYEVD